MLAVAVALMVEGKAHLVFVRPVARLVPAFAGQTVLLLASSLVNVWCQKHEVDKAPQILSLARRLVEQQHAFGRHSVMLRALWHLIVKMTFFVGREGVGFYSW